MGMRVEDEWLGDAIPGRIGPQGRKGVNRAAHRLRAVAIPRTPVDTGNLRGSFRISAGGRGDPSALVIVDANYGIYVHEILDNHHDEGEAKFLENSLNDSRGELLAIIIADLREAFT